VSFSREEIEAAVDRYVELRGRIDAGEATWRDFADQFTDDVVFVDPAWGRVEGKAALLEFLEESMDGLDDWRFPVEFTAIAGDRVVVKWLQIMPGTRADGSPIQQSGISTLVYAGAGRFRYEEDLLNMVHVIEDIKVSTWRPKATYVPPSHPVRDFSIPSREVAG
jgi:ketosteroid isomerase-like protein